MQTYHAAHGPLRGSHLRHVSTGNSSAAENNKVATSKALQVEASELETPEPPLHEWLNLSIHEDTISKEDVLLNLTALKGPHCEGVLQLTPPNRRDVSSEPNVRVEAADVNRSLLFLHKPLSQELLSKQPSFQISVSRRVAAAFGFEKGMEVLVSKANQHDSIATHVEFVFRDQYLARADMWQLIESEMCGKCIYRGQKIEFMSSIRAQIKNVFVQGRKVQSALFHHSTKPIFRSESARYVLFIQMSKEMWDFDTEGSGEIMFDKVINGFLPELFKRWHELKVKHVVSVVLFTRMVYEEAARRPDISPTSLGKDQEESVDRQNLSQDFYRVVVSDMASCEWANILSQLKKEFKVFLRDISIRKPNKGDTLPLQEGLSSALADTPSYVIAGHPSSAMHGNLLEAINLASSQFSSDYIDRDLVRTGVSIMVLSPGPGVFEVEYNLLAGTSENLIDNGVGIDLVCLSRMPLHSIPLFKYRPPPAATNVVGSMGMDMAKNADGTPTGSLATGNGLGKSSELFAPQVTPQTATPNKTWNYGIPHWIDVSFWTSVTGDAANKTDIVDKPKDLSSFAVIRHKTFIPRVKMYELQMMGVMENAISDISIPRLPQTALGTAKKPVQFVRHLIPGSSYKQSDLSVPDSIDMPHKTYTPLSNSFASGQSSPERSVRLQFQWMNHYDDLLFRHPGIAQKRARRLQLTSFEEQDQKRHEYSPSLLGTSADDRSREKLGSATERQQNGVVIKRGVPHAISKREKATETQLSKETVRPRMHRPTRHISFGPRGFSAKAVPSTEVTTKHGEASLLSRGLNSEIAAKPSGMSIAAPSKTRKQSDRQAVQDVDARSSEGIQSESETRQSRPIPIRNSAAVRMSSDNRTRSKHQRMDSQDNLEGSQLHNRLAALQDLREHEEEVSTAHMGHVEDGLPLPVALSPSTTLAPWLTILNPSNPSKTKKALAMRLGRWQHVFPRPLKTSQIKWRSLCSPAAVPLTTEDFPSAEQLAEEYEIMTYEIDLPPSSELSENPRSLALELLTFRLSRGFQIVVGPRVAESTSVPDLKAVNVFDKHLLEETGATVFLSRGSTLHRLSRVSSDKIEVKEIRRYAGDSRKDFEGQGGCYKPFIRSMLAPGYEIQEISIAPYRSSFDWKVIDAFIAGHERPQAQDFVESLRPWRARYVLIPVEGSSGARRRQRSDEDDDEEIRLEGIRKLTQLWQRFRYVPPDERRYQAPLRKRKDTNPLDIMYQTRDPSAIVAAELDNVADADATGGTVQLLPESDLYQRSNFTIAGLAETIQSDKGVRMLDRRWHLRLHYNCFIGFELTTWLLQNFRDVDTRDEAVDLGNELMKSGMFKHVEQRHNFRDGNYFYQVADEYRTPRPESRSWFARGKTSVPSTPMSEDGPKELPTAGRSRSNSNGDCTDDSDPTTPTRSGKKQRLSVALSKSLIYDVDHRKRSYRPELINLHYDRLHNPDNCYHIRIEWMNTTPKLIQDTIVSWAMSVDRFGLRLVEIPLGEASSITNIHPFRAPYLIKLAKRPPEKQPQSYFDNTSFAPQPKIEKHFYQKALLKRFNFVLDFEAASDFPTDVDVTYSWGKPDYHYPQYIHRSGMLIAQIRGDGDFLVLANRLYSSRYPAYESNQEINWMDQTGDNEKSRGPEILRSNPHRGNHANPRPSPHDSPYSSPSVRATLEVPPSLNPSRGPPLMSSTQKKIDSSRAVLKSSYNTPDSITKDIEAFCSDAQALALFYEEVLSKASTPEPSTPFFGNKTSNKESESGFHESGIPVLALPGSLVGKGSNDEGETEWTINGRHTGKSDIPLTHNGMKQVLSASETLVGYRKVIDPSKFVHVFVSPRIRAQTTLDILLGHDGEERAKLEKEGKVTTTEDIAEWDYGYYEGLVPSEIRKRRKEKGLDMDRAWNIWEDGCEGGESPAQVTQRLDGLIQKIRALQEPYIKDGGNGDILLVAHGHILRAFTKRWLNYSMNFPFPMMMEPGAVGVLSYAHHNIDEPSILIGMGFPQKA
ncbi:vacuolar membrane-associated protein iml1 [Lecanora helva]